MIPRGIGSWMPYGSLDSRNDVGADDIQSFLLRAEEVIE
jgi:hypothetical protein